MRQYIIENKHFILLCLIWLLTGMYLEPALYVILPLSLILLNNKGYYQEIFIGFLFVLTLSDSRLRDMAWAGSIKNIYIVLFTYFSLKQYSQMSVKIKWHLYLLPFILIACIGLLSNPQFNVSAQKTLSYYLLFFSVPNYFLFTYERYGKQFLKNIIYFISLLLVIGLVLHVFSPAITTLASRYRGLLGNPNGIGIYCFLFFAFSVIVNEIFPDLFQPKERFVLYGVILFSLVLCGARSSLLASLIFIGFRHFNKLSPALGFLILILIAGTYEIVSTNVVAIVQSLGLERYARVETLESGSGRLVAWQFALEQIEKNFFFGKGFNYTEYIYGVYEKKLSMMGHQGAAHNAYLTFWLNTGVVGLLAFLVGFLSFVFSISKYSFSVLALLYGVLFSNQFESWLTASLNPFTILMLMSFTLILSAQVVVPAEEPADDPVPSPPMPHALHGV